MSLSMTDFNGPGGHFKRLAFATAIFSVMTAENVFTDGKAKIVTSKRKL